MKTISQTTAVELLICVKALEEHLDWIGWGDSYERSCIGKMPENTRSLIERAERERSE